MLQIVGIFQEFCTNCWKISVGRERRLWHPNYKSIYSMSQTCFTQLFSIIPCEHSKNKQTSFDFLGLCSRLPETKTKLVGKTQNQLSALQENNQIWQIDNLDLQTSILNLYIFKWNPAICMKNLSANPLQQLFMQFHCSRQKKSPHIFLLLTCPAPQPLDMLQWPQFSSVDLSLNEVIVEQTQATVRLKVWLGLPRARFRWAAEQACGNWAWSGGALRSMCEFHFSAKEGVAFRNWSN